MKPILIFKPQFNNEEQKEIADLSLQIWKKLVNEHPPPNTDGKRYFVRHSIKVEMQEGLVIILDTTTHPYMPINNRYILRLLLGNILLEK